MAPANNWLSFSLSSVEMLTTSQPQLTAPYDASHQYLIDNFCTHGWGTNKTQVLFNTEEQDHARYEYKDFSILGPNIPNTTRKLEDFFGETSSSMVTEAHDSSLMTTHNNYQQHQDLKAITGFQSSFSANSGSEVDDSSPHQLTEFGGGHSIESAVGNELRQGQTNRGTNNNVNGNGDGGLSLGVVNEKAIVDTSDNSKKIVDTFGQRTSIYRGVTRHRWTGRYEAHLWDNSCRREGQARKGRQVYLGGYDKEDKAARAYDLAALKYWGPTATTNFPIANYTKELEEMKHVTKQEFIASLRRKSSGFSRGASVYRGVTRHHQQGRWQARIGRVAGNKDLYLGTFATEEEAAEAYDIAAIKFRGLNAVTNFEMNRYDVEAIMKSALPIGGAAKRSKLTLEADQKPCLSYDQHRQCSTGSNSISFAGVDPISAVPCGIPYDQSAALYQYSSLYQLPSTVGGAPALAMPQPAEFFLWPNHQSY